MTLIRIDTQEVPVVRFCENHSKVIELVTITTVYIVLRMSVERREKKRNQPGITNQ